MLTVIENIGSTPLSLTNCAIDGVGNVNSYVQIDVHNSSNGALASSDVIATADSGSDTTQYVDMGVNSSGFSNPAWTVSGPLDAYVYASDGNLTVGTAGTKSLIFHTGGLLAANIRLTISPTGYASFALPPKVPSYTVATLPAPASAGAGAKAFVSDSTAITFASVVVGGGSAGVPVYCDGTSWRIG
jgi:hypothetical protein